eukprot:1991882-Rhodomonas_salina.1
MSEELLAAQFIGCCKRRNHAAGVCQRGAAVVPRPAIVKFLEETEERSRRSDEGRGPRLFAVQTKRGEAGGHSLTEDGRAWSRGGLPGNCSKNHVRGCGSAPARFPTVRPPGCHGDQ